MFKQNDRVEVRTLAPGRDPSTSPIHGRHGTVAREADENGLVRVNIDALGEETLHESALVAIENDWAFLEKVKPIQDHLDTVADNCVPDVAAELRSGDLLSRYLAKLKEEGRPLPPFPGR